MLRYSIVVLSVLMLAGPSPATATQGLVPLVVSGVVAQSSLLLPTGGSSADEQTPRELRLVERENGIEIVVYVGSGEDKGELKRGESSTWGVFSILHDSYSPGIEISVTARTRDGAVDSKSVPASRIAGRDGVVAQVSLPDPLTPVPPYVVVRAASEGASDVAEMWFEGQIRFAKTQHAFGLGDPEKDFAAIQREFSELMKRVPERSETDLEAFAKDAYRGALEGLAQDGLDTADIPTEFQGIARWGGENADDRMSQVLNALNDGGFAELKALVGTDPTFMEQVLTLSPKDVSAEWIDPALWDQVGEQFAVMAKTVPANERAPLRVWIGTQAESEWGAYWTLDGAEAPVSVPPEEAAESKAGWIETLKENQSVAHYAFVRSLANVTNVPAEYRASIQELSAHVQPAMWRGAGTGTGR